MGQKVNPFSYRLGITEDWRSRWYAGKQTFGAMLVEDQKLRKFIQGKYRFAGIPRVDIERTREEVRVHLYTMRPGIIIGRKGAEVEVLRGKLEEMTGRKVNISIKEILKPELNAQLVADSVGEQLQRRASFKRAIKRSAEMTLEAGALGVRIRIAGRLGGSEMARTEQVSMGSIPLSTLRAKVDYGLAEVRTTYGAIGVKCWIYLGEVDQDGVSEVEAKLAAQTSGRSGMTRQRVGAGGRGGGRGGRGGRRRSPRSSTTTTRSGRVVQRTDEETDQRRDSGAKGRPQGKEAAGAETAEKQSPSGEAKTPEERPAAESQE